MEWNSYIETIFFTADELKVMWSIISKMATWIPRKLEVTVNEKDNDVK